MNIVNELSNSSYEWNVEKIITSENTGNNFVLVILNTPILLPFDYFNSFWNKAKLRVAVDGGSNRLFDITQKPHIKNADNYIPDIISGDFDSINNEVFDYYKKHGVKMIFTSNQEETDFFKALKIVLEKCPQISTIVTLCEFQGRFDHAAANLNTLHKAAKYPKMEHLKIYILNPTGIMWLLKPGKHKIDIPKHLWHKNSICSLVPIGNPCHNVTTTGLKWNLGYNSDLLKTYSNTNLGDFFIYGKNYCSVI